MSDNLCTLTHNFLQINKLLKVKRISDDTRKVRVLDLFFLFDKKEKNNLHVYPMCSWSE